MSTRMTAAGLAFALVVAVVLTSLSGETGTCDSTTDPSCIATAGPSAPIATGNQTAVASPTSSQPIESSLPTPTVPETPAPSATPPVYTFRDEFNGTRLRSVWGRHWPGFGNTLWSSAQVSVGDGVLTIRARRSGTKWVSGLIDTVGTFTQRYGVFSVRMKFVEGNGLWPAFWLAQPQNKAREIAEIDVMEVCANNVGVDNGNDVTLLHHYVHKIDGSHAFALGYRTDNLAGEWHVYTVDWRKDRITFYLDGLETSTFSFTSDTDVSDMRMAIVLDLAVGGGFCKASDSSTPKAPTLQVDWVRVTR